MDKAEALERYYKRKETEYNSMEKDELVSELLKKIKEDEYKADCIRNNQKDEFLKELISDEELKQILKENLKNAIIERSKDSHFVNMLFFDYQNQPKEVLKNFLENSFDKENPLIKEFQDNIANYLKTNYKKICESVMLNAFLRGLAKDSPFLYEAVSDIISEREDW